jgi:hypothetical protein
MVFALGETNNPFSWLDPIGGQSDYLRIVIALVVAFITYDYYYKRSDKYGGIHSLPGIPIMTASMFFNKQFDFLSSHFKHHGFFQFRVLHVRISKRTSSADITDSTLLLKQHKVVAISGDEARRVFFGDHHLDFSEGYKILLGIVCHHLPQSLLSFYLPHALGY